MDQNTHFESAVTGFFFGRKQGHQRGHDEGFAEGEDVGFDAGVTQGRRDGFAQGLRQGRHEGYGQGWNEGVAAGNVQIERANAYIEQHLSDKEALRQALDEQQKLIEQLDAKIVELESTNAALREENAAVKANEHALREMLTALRESHDRLAAQYTTMAYNFEALSKEHTAQIFEHNRNMVFLNAVRDVLEELTREDTPQATQVREIFAQHYTDQVNAAMDRGTITSTLEADDAFAREMPATRAFIVRMLQGVAERDDGLSNDGFGL